MEKVEKEEKTAKEIWKEIDLFPIQQIKCNLLPKTVLLFIYHSPLRPPLFNIKPIHTGGNVLLKSNAL